jgi:ABC-2 type transport system permease protein
MINIYRRFWQVNWAEQWQYRANLMMYLLYWLVSPIVYLSVWTAVANSQGNVQGLTANDFQTYYMTLLVVDVLTSNTLIYSLAFKISQGTLSGDLLLPVHPVVTSTLMGNLAFKALTFIALVPIWLVLYLLVRPDYSAVTAGSLLLSVPAIILGFSIGFFLDATVTCLAFWTTRVYSIADFFIAVALLFSGQFVPLTLMPPVIQALARILPFQFTRYFPVQIILNQLPPEAIARNFALGVGWLIVLVCLFLVVWRAGLKRYSAVGA